MNEDAPIEVGAENDAEDCLLGALLLDPGRFAELEGAFSPDDLTSARHRALWVAIAEVYTETGDSDMLMARDAALRLGVVWPLDDLMTLTNKVPSAVHALHYARIVRAAAARRAIAKAAGRLAAHAHDHSTTVDELRAELSKATEQAFAYIERATSQHIAESLREVTTTARETAKRSIATGIASLDQIIGGLRPGELVVVGGRTSQGKTTLLLNILCHAALALKLPVGLISLEMPRTTIARNLLTLTGRLFSTDWLRGTFSAEAHARLVAASQRLQVAPIYIADPATLSADRLVGTCRKLRHDHKIELLAIDYLGLVSAGDRRASLYERTTEASHVCKGIARELDIPVLLAVQVNRGPDQGEARKPRLSDLRDSGAIEQDADVVLLLNQDRKTPGQAYLNLYVAKHRVGPIGECTLKFIGEHMLITECSAGEQEPWGQEELD